MEIHVADLDRACELVRQVGPTSQMSFDNKKFNEIHLINKT